MADAPRRYVGGGLWVTDGTGDEHPDVLAHRARVESAAGTSARRLSAEALTSEPFVARDFCGCGETHARGCYVAGIRTEPVPRRDAYGRRLEDGARVVFPADVPQVVEAVAQERELVCVLDTETTGLMPEGRVCEIAVAVVDLVTGAIVKRASQLVNPGVPVTPGSRAVHGISDAMLVGMPPLVDVWPRIVAFVAEHCPALDVVAHSAAFDRSVLGATLLATDWPRWHWRCSVTLARRQWPSFETHSLHDNAKGRGLATRLKLPPQAHHRALGDALLTAGVLAAIRGERGEPWAEWCGAAHVWGEGAQKTAKASTQQQPAPKRARKGEAVGPGLFGRVGT